MTTMGYRYRAENKGGLVTKSPTTDKIFDWLYKCSVPALHSRTVEDIRLNGVMVTGIKDLDEGLKNDWIRKYMSINSMVELFKRGVPIKVIDEKDTKDIYNSIQAHLLQWYEQIRTGMNIGDAPMEDLLLLDKFAALVYGHAKYFFTPEVLQSMFGEHIANNQRVNMSNFFQNSNPYTGAVERHDVTTNKFEPVVTEERISFEDRFKVAAQSLRKY